MDRIEPVSEREDGKGRDVVRRIVIPCSRGRTRHRWDIVPGILSTPEHPYTERRCRHCRSYESEVR